MATITYQVENSVPEFSTTYSAKFDATSDETRPIVTPLADGGFAVAFQWAKLPQPGDQTIVVDIYNSDGSRRFGDTSVLINKAVAGSSTVDAAMTQLTDGRLLVSWTDTDNAGIHYGIINPSTGLVLVTDRLMDWTDENDLASDVVAIAGGGWALVKQDDVAPTDQDADLLIYNSAGTNIAETALNNNAGEDEQAPSAAVLKSGPYAGHIAVAYERETFNDTDEFSIVVELFTPAGKRVLGPIVLDSAGQNRRPDIVALNDGGFAVAYEDDTWGPPGASVGVFDAAGNLRGILRVDSNANVDRDLSIGVLANGFIYVTWTEAAASEDIRSAIFDPATLARVMSYGAVETQALPQDHSSVAMLANGKVVTAWTDANPTLADGNTDPGDAHVSIQIDEIVRVTTGDAAGETLSGDALVDRIHGNGGADTLNGLGGNDFLYGDAGEDTLDGGSGDDTLAGGADSDIYLVDSMRDVVVESATGGAADWVKAASTYDLLEGVHVEILSTTNDKGTAAINLYGNTLKQTTTGNAGRNILSDGGKGAADTLIGLGGNDTYKIYNAGTVVVEGAGEGLKDTV
ncbi:MAG: hypothetical protein KF914_08275, partial [Rhizobiaceae bacterium]|nr:hypothetical protein [Rhizobiaceae bacterium]